MFSNNKCKTIRIKSTCNTKQFYYNRLTNARLSSCSSNGFSFFSRARVLDRSVATTTRIVVARVYRSYAARVSDSDNVLFRTGVYGAAAITIRIPSNNI